MKQNIGNIDRLMRITVAIILSVLIFTKVLNQTAAIIAGIAAVIMLLTAIIRTCPLYLPFKINTKK